MVYGYLPLVKEEIFHHLPPRLYVAFEVVELAVGGIEVLIRYALRMEIIYEAVFLRTFPADKLQGRIFKLSRITAVGNDFQLLVVANNTPQFLYVLVVARYDAHAESGCGSKESAILQVADLHLHHPLPVFIAEDMIYSIYGKRRFGLLVPCREVILACRMEQRISEFIYYRIHYSRIINGVV